MSKARRFELEIVGAIIDAAGESCTGATGGVVAEKA